MKLEFHKLALLPLFTGIHEEDLSAMLACLGSFQKNYRRDEIILLESNEVRSVGVILSSEIMKRKRLCFIPAFTSST